METIDDQHYIDARETLFDAVEALAPHSDAVILVGALYVEASLRQSYVEKLLSLKMNRKKCLM